MLFPRLILVLFLCLYSSYFKAAVDVIAEPVPTQVYRMHPYYIYSRRLAAVDAMARQLNIRPPRPLQTSPVVAEVLTAVQGAAAVSRILYTVTDYSIRSGQSTTSHETSSHHATQALRDGAMFALTLTTDYLVGTPLSQLQTIDPRAYQVLHSYTKAEWLEQIHEVKKSHLFTTQPTFGPPITHEQRATRAVMDRFELYGHDNFRQAIESLPEFDAYMIDKAKEVKYSAKVQQELKDISQQALDLEMQRAHPLKFAWAKITKKQPFDIAQYIETRAQLAEKNKDIAWFKSNEEISHETFCPETLEQHTTTTRALAQDVEFYAKNAANLEQKQQYEDFLHFVQKVERDLPNISDGASITKEYFVPRDSKAYDWNVQTTTDRQAPTWGDSAPVYVRRNHVVGNDVQIGIHKKAIGIIEQAKSLDLKAISNQQNRAVVDKLVTTSQWHADQAIFFNQSGDLPRSLEHLRTSFDLTQQAQEIVSGRYDYSATFSPEVVTRLEGQVKTNQALVNTTLKNGVPNNPASRFAYDTMQQSKKRLDELSQALQSLKNGNHSIVVKEYQLNQAAQDLLKKNKIATAPFTRCIGNEYQQVRHKQMVDLINQSAQLYGQHSADRLVADMAHATVRMSEKAMKLATTDIEFAAQLHSANQAIFDATHAIVRFPIDLAAQAVKGVYENTEDFVYGIGYAAHHPKEVVHNAVKAALHVIDLIDLFDSDQLLLSPSRQMDMVDKTQHIGAALKNTCDNLAQMSLYDLSMGAAYNAGYFGSQIVLNDAVLHCVGHTVKLTYTGAKRATQVATTASSKALEGVANKLSKAAVDLERSVAQAEVKALATIELEKKAAQVAGTKIEIPLNHLNEKLIEKHGAGKVAAEMAEIGAERKVVLEAEKKLASDTATAVSDAFKNIPATCAKLDPSIGNIKKIEEAITVFKESPGAVGTDGPISRVLRLGKKNAVPGQLSRARGSAYELEAALDVKLKGEKDIVFGNRHQIIKNGSATTIEADIETATKIIECKNWYWSKQSEAAINDFKEQLLDLRMAAEKCNKTLKFYSKHSLPKTLKEWLAHEKIPFTEG